MQVEFDYTVGPTSPLSAVTGEVRRLEELVAVYQTFTGHELTNQVVPLQGFAQMLLLAADGPLDADSQDLLTRIADMARKLEILARRLSGIGRVLREPPFGPPLATGDVAREAAAEVEATLVPIASPVNYHIREDLPRASISRRLLHEVFVEVLRNAAQAIPPGEVGEVEIEGRTSGEAVDLIIRDNGAGFPPGQPERLLEPFMACRQPGARGTGLGLLLVRQAAALWRGRLTLRSETGSGTEVTLSLPGV